MTEPDRHRPHAPLRVRIRKVVLTLHWLAGMVAMIAMLFFAVTGLMLNNAESWGLGDGHDEKREVKLDSAAADRWTNGDAAIVAVLRAGVGVSGIPDKAEVRDGRMVLVFKSAGTRREVSIDPADGSAVIDTETHGVSGRLMALHRGEDVRRGWHLLMDFAAILLIVLTLSGFFLWIATPRWRNRGWAALALSVAAIAGAYLLCV